MVSSGRNGRESGQRTPDGKSGRAISGGPASGGFGSRPAPDASLEAARTTIPPASGDQLRLAELMAARLCHEVSGPAGTLAGAVEIARTEPGAAVEALDIAAAAGAALAARIRLLRAAWAGGAEASDIAALRRLCAGLPRHVLADLDGLPPEQLFPPAFVHVLLNVVLLAAESLPKGGVVRLGDAGPDAALVVPSGQDAAWPQGLAAWIADPTPAWRAVSNAAPRGLQGPLTALLAHAAGARLSFALAAEAEAAPPLLIQLP